MLCNVNRPDDVTTSELNHAGFRFAIVNQFESIKIDYSQLYYKLPQVGPK